MLWVLLLFLIVQSIYATIGCETFRDDHPEHFYELKQGMFTMFRITTLDGWETIARDLDDSHPVVGMLYCMSYLVISEFILIHLILAIVTDSLIKDDKARAVHRQKKLDKKFHVNQAIILK